MGLGFCPPIVLDDDVPLDGFECGEDVVDSWVRAHAHRAQKTGTAVVYVCLTSANEVAGLYSLSMHSVVRSSVSAGALRRNSPTNIPVILLGMLGVDRRFQGSGLGKLLLRDALKRSISASGIVGVKALVVEPASSAAAAFYAKYGFRALNSEGKMFLKLPLGG